MESTLLIREKQRTEEARSRAQDPTRPGGARKIAAVVRQGLYRWAASTRLALARAL